jgi:hypothetical protein
LLLLLLLKVTHLAMETRARVRAYIARRAAALANGSIKNFSFSLLPVTFRFGESPPWLDNQAIPL